MKLEYFDADKINSKKNETNRIIEQIVNMDKNNACKVSDIKSRLNTLKQRLYSEHKGLFRISDREDHIIITKK